MEIRRNKSYEYLGSTMESSNKKKTWISLSSLGQMDCLTYLLTNFVTYQNSVFSMAVFQTIPKHTASSSQDVYTSLTGYGPGRWLSFWHHVDIFFFLYFVTLF